MYVDLSVLLDEKTPVYPGDPAIKIEQAGVMERDGFTDHYVSIGTHAGTHIDAPLHMIANGKTLSQAPLTQFMGQGRLIEAKDGFNLERIRQASIQEGDIVLFHTGMDKHYREQVYFKQYPTMSEEMAHYLVECKVKMVGVDAGSVDNDDGFPIHKILLDGEVLIIENLANLEQLAGKDFTIYALPLKLDIDAAPARVIAAVR